MRLFNELLSAAFEAEITPGYTGRYLVLLEEGAGPSVLTQSNISAASTADFEGGLLSPEAVRELDAVLFQIIGVALVDAPPERLASARVLAAEGSAILAVEPERICEAIAIGDDLIRIEADQGLTLDYLRGYRDAVRELSGKLVTEPVRPPYPRRCSTNPG